MPFVDSEGRKLIIPKCRHPKIAVFQWGVNLKQLQAFFYMVLSIAFFLLSNSSCILVSCAAPSYAYDCNITRLNRGNIHDSPRRPAGNEIDS
ncbi:hypothetical protein T02_1534 [Trichinella nativa]|uniref:Uncharacterized protein n=1 Tax=Trichinella nativa TaxID=6335 RepID=A0A0V1KL03_9BILA|nr:hypothetical protein T02_1534 [Trichinella nativa]